MDHRLVAGAGGNGSLYVNDEGTDGWIERAYDLDLPGAFRSVRDLDVVGSTLLVGGTTGLYRSIDRGDTWTRFPVTGPVDNASFAVAGSRVYAALTNTLHGTDLYVSDDAGSTWRRIPSLPRAYLSELAANGTTLFAGRFDGLWTLPLSATQGH